MRDKSGGEPNATRRSFRNVFALLMLLVAAAGSATGHQELSPDATKDFKGHEYFVGPGLSLEFSGGVFRYIVDEPQSSRRRMHLQESTAPPISNPTA